MKFNRFDFSERLSYTHLEDENRLQVREFTVATAGGDYRLSDARNQPAEEIRKSFLTKLTTHQL